ATGQPNRRVIPEWLLDIDPGARALASFGEERHRRRVLAFGSDDIQGPTQVEIEQRAPAPLVLSPHQVIKPVPVKSDDRICGRETVCPRILVVPPGNDRRHMQIITWWNN